MKNIVKISLILICVVVVVVTICNRCMSRRNAEITGAVPEEEVHPRIVSLAPSITEALFALGLGANVVGVSRFCDYPPDVTNIISVGGYDDLDPEAVIRLRPDIVVAPKTARHVEAVFDKFKINTLLVEQDTFQQIIDSMWILGEELDRADVAAEWLKAMDTIVSVVSSSAPQSNVAPRIMIVVSRMANSLDKVFIAGPNNFYDDLLKIAGGRNAYSGSAPYPVVGLEGIIKMNPDIIIDIATEKKDGLSADDIKKQWTQLKGVKAVDSGRIYILTKSWAVRPGPRIGFLLDRLSNIVKERTTSSAE